MSEMTVPVGRQWPARLLRWLQHRTVAKRDPDFVVGDDPNRPYLRRWFVIPRNLVANAYLHNFRRSDDNRALHDHPWVSCSIVLAGGYWEHLADGRRVWRGPGAVAFRRAKSAHRVELPMASGLWEAPAWTLFLTGPRIRQWGFQCPQGWRHWRDFCGVGADGKNNGNTGKGCA